MASRPSTNRALWTGYLLGAVTGVALVALAVELNGRRSPDLRLYRSVRDLVREEFVEPVGSEHLVDEALGGMLESLDPYSHFYTRDEVARLERETNGTFTGIGIVLAAPAADFRVLYAVPGSPAAGKLRVGDRLISVDGEPLAGSEPGRLQELVAASGGREVSFEVESRAGEPRREDLTPTRVVDQTVRHAGLLDESRGIGYVAITSFSRETPAEFDAAVELLRGLGLRGLIVDLRDNPGGVLQSAVEIANRFVAEGTLVSTRSRRATRVYEAAPEAATLADLPLALLVDGGSASASEVLAGAIQDHRAGVLVGAPTYGKGMVQTLQPYGERAVVKLTTAYYTTPADRRIDRHDAPACGSGIDPDLLVPVAERERLEVRACLARYSPPHAQLADIRRWEREEGVELLPTWPEDRQRRAALDLFAGRVGGVPR